MLVWCFDEEMMGRSAALAPLPQFFGGVAGGGGLPGPGPQSWSEDTCVCPPGTPGNPIGGPGTTYECYGIVYF